MKNTKLFITAFFLSYLNTLGAQTKEWDKYPIPINIESGKEWRLNSQSDDFNYQFKSPNKLTEFASRWRNYYHSKWSGPSPTIW